MIIGIVGLGYVGLPLASLFAQKFTVIGFDSNEQKIQLLQKGIDYTQEVGADAIRNTALSFTTNASLLQTCNVIIVAVPTDIDAENQPDLRPLQQASVTIGNILKPGMVVVYESTVYPGLTEEECIPILEKQSGLVWKKDFFVGYSPERINPGDKNRPLHKILKIVSGDTPQTTDLLANLYGSVIEAGIYQAPNIKTAEAAKVIENAQRDLNIAFMNELAVIFNKMGLDTREVLEAAGTKWNFLPFEPGLVGGHCIGVDPYYLTFKAERLGYSPQVIHSGRHLNNQMGQYIAEKVIKSLIATEKVVAKSRVLILGCTFKENIGDIRNSKVFDIAATLQEYHVRVDMVDPLIKFGTLHASQQPILAEIPHQQPYDAIVVAVKHQVFAAYSLAYLQSISVNSELQLFDIKAFFNRNEALAACKHYWRL